MEMIKTQDLAFTYPGTEDQVNTRALRGVDVTIERGSFVVILGHNGSGKSTLAKTFNAVLLPSGGKVYVEGMDTMDESLLLEIRRRVGMVFQNPDNQIVANVVEEDVAFAPENLGVPSAEIRKRVDDALEAVGMTQFVKHAPHLLSGGQKQRVGIARALANNPSILLCDEATSALDPKTTDSILDLLKKINETLHITIVIITHEMNVIQKICNKVAVMDFGKVVETGSVIQVFSDPQSDIAKRFVGNLIHDVIPEPLVESIRRETRNSRLLRIKLENTDSTEPLLWDINRRFEVETNILYSTINVIQGIVVGIMLVLFIGSDEEIKKAERYILESNEEYKEVVLP